MPTGPKGERRPADVIGNAVKVMRIATGEEVEELSEKNPHAVALGNLGGNKGGKKRATKLSPRRRKEIAEKAAAARWGKRN